jgi:hypothetical protein
LLVLDTDHLSEWQRDSAAGQRLRSRLEASRPELAISIPTVEQHPRGWLAEVNRHADVHRQINPYGKLQKQIEIFAEWLVLPWDPDSANLFLNFRKQGVRIGTLVSPITSKPASRGRIKTSHSKVIC